MQNLKKPEVNLDWMDTPVKSDKWKNVFFSKNGQSYLALKVWGTEAVALQNALRVLNDKYSSVMLCEGPIKYQNLTTNVPTGNTGLMKKDISHTIQIPWKD